MLRVQLGLRQVFLMYFCAFLFYALCYWVVSNGYWLTGNRCELYHQSDATVGDATPSGDPFNFIDAYMFSVEPMATIGYSSPDSIFFNDCERSLSRYAAVTDLSVQC